MQRNYIRDVGRFASFLGRPPDTATADELRRFQVGQQNDGVPMPTMNSIVSALRFFFTHTVDRPDLARKLVRLAHPRKLTVVLSRAEVARLINATTCLKHQARDRCGDQRPGVAVAQVCRRYGIATSMAFRWRVEFGLTARKAPQLAMVALADGMAQELPALAALRR